MATGMAVLVAAGACSDGDDGDRAQPTLTTPSTTATTAAPSTTTTEAGPERVEAEPPPGEPRPDIDVNVTYPADFDEEQIEVVAAYRGYWHAAYLVNDPCGPTEPGESAACLPDPDNELIAQFAIGERLDSVRENAAENRAAGEVVVLQSDGLYRHDVLQVDIDGSSATIRACALDDAVVLAASSGDVLDDEVLTRSYLVSLTFEGGRWRVVGSQLTTLDQWDGEEMAQCASDASQ